MQTMSDPIAAVLGSWSSQLTIPSIALRMALSFLFAAVIGCERSNKRHSAGLRTFILVALSSTAATLLDLFLMEISKLYICHNLCGSCHRHRNYQHFFHSL